MVTILKNQLDKIKKQKKNNFLQFVKFSIVGVSNTVISLIIYYIFIIINEDWYMAGQIASWIISVGNSFYWNNKYVFKSNENSFKSIIKRIIKTYISYGSVFLLICFLLWLEVDILRISEYIAPIINIILTTPLNFVINKLWAFNQRPEKRTDNETTVG